MNPLLPPSRLRADPVGSDHSKFAAFILTHGRADTVSTYRELKRSGYTGAVYLVIDDEDDRADRYRELYGDDRVIQFCKREVAERVDTCDLRPDRKAIVFARNACHDIAREMGLDYHLQLDDDYTGFYHRVLEMRDGKQSLAARRVRNLDGVVDAALTFLDDSGAACLSFAQGGDLIGGLGIRNGAPSGNYRKGLMRKAMNTLFFKTDHEPRVRFVGRFNEDASAYVVGGQRGELHFMYTGVSIAVKLTQLSGGGMTDAYLGSGTYVKTMYSLIQAPSCVKVSLMGYANPRFHHFVDWPRCAPMIISERHRKPRGEEKTQ